MDPNETWCRVLESLVAKDYADCMLNIAALEHWRKNRGFAPYIGQRHKTEPEAFDAMLAVLRAHCHEMIKGIGVGE